MRQVELNYAQATLILKSNTCMCLIVRGRLFQTHTNTSKQSCTHYCYSLHPFAFVFVCQISIQLLFTTAIWEREPLLRSSSGQDCVYTTSTFGLRLDVSTGLCGEGRTVHTYAQAPPPLVCASLHRGHIASGVGTDRWHWS